MKAIIKYLAAAIMLCTLSTSAVAQSKADLKAAKKEAKSLAKKGWEVSPGDLPLAEQIASGWEVIRDKDNWVIGEATTQGSIYDVVQSNSLFQAQVNIEKNIKVIVDKELGIGQDNEKATGQGLSSASYTTFTEVAKAAFENEISHPRTLMRCHRTLKDGTIEVQTRIAIHWSLQEVKDKVNKKLNNQ